MIEQIKTIRELSRTEQILQLAEEANELAIESIKLRRKMMFRVIYPDAAFIEEIADVKICIDIIGDYADNIKPYQINHSRNQILELLEKYCCELSKAAIKYRRTLVANSSPTLISEIEAEEKLLLEITKVKSCIDALGDYWDSDEVNRIYVDKANRCIDRYNER